MHLGHDPTMELTAQMRQAIESSVLCWLATVDSEGQPNVSPTEVFPDRDQAETRAGVLARYGVAASPPETT